MAKRLLGVLLAFALVVVAAACSDDDNDKKSDDTSAEASDGGGGGGGGEPADPDAATTEIAEAFNTFVTTPEVADKLAVVEGGDNPEFSELFGRINDRLTSLIPTGGLSVANLEADFTSETEAEVTFDLVGGDGAPLLADQPGTAVYEDGQWKVSLLTVCDLTSLGDATLGSECADFAATQ